MWNKLFYYSLNWLIVFCICPSRSSSLTASSSSSKSLDYSSVYWLCVSEAATSFFATGARACRYGCFTACPEVMRFYGSFSSIFLSKSYAFGIYNVSFKVKEFFLSLYHHLAHASTLGPPISQYQLYFMPTLRCRSCHWKVIFPLTYD
jgi:hypothetical protein